jgi:ParB family chromosome partitioning protein
MVRSVKEFGVIVPVIIRLLDEVYESYKILSGHNRVNAAKIAGLRSVPVVIKTGLDDDEAKLIVTETNLIQRSFADLSHSERAITLHTDLEALKSSNGGQGKRTELIDEIKMLSNPHTIKENLTSPQVGEKLLSVEKTGSQNGLFKNTVARYVRLTFLINDLLNRVEFEEIAFIPAVLLSYLSPDKQNELNRILNESAYKVDMKKAETLRECSESKKLTNDKMVQVLSGEVGKKPKSKTGTSGNLLYVAVCRIFS